jgi:hypothetical protein
MRRQTMHCIKATLSVFISLLPAVNLYAQISNGSQPQKTHWKMTIRNAPALTLQFSGGYNYGVYELSGNDNGDFSPVELRDGRNFGVRHGVGGGLTVKIPLHERGNIRLNVAGLYNYFSSNFNKLNREFGQSVYATYRVISGEVGVENNFTPNHRIKTLVGGGFVASIISGKARVVNDGPDLTIKPAFRLGVSVYSGLEYMLSNRIGLNFEFKFTHANLLLKKSKQSDNANEIYLNDARTGGTIPYSGFKQFAWGSFYGGVNVYFGIKEKSYVYRK